jgi:hypothetical protein
MGFTSEQLRNFWNFETDRGDKMLYFNLIYCVLRHFQQYFSYIMATSFSGGRSRSTQRELPTMDKQLVNFITCGS